MKERRKASNRTCAAASSILPDRCGSATAPLSWANSTTPSAPWTITAAWPWRDRTGGWQRRFGQRWGSSCLGIKRNKEAYFHLSGAFQEAVASKNALAGYFAKGGLAIHHFTEGRLKEAQNWIQQTTSEGAATGLINQYASPIVLETLFELHRKGFLHVAHMNFPTEFERIMREQNVHLRGVALRLKSVDAIENHGAADGAQADLKRSEQLLIQSGDPVQLGKTRLEMARLNLRRGDETSARNMADAARKDFGSYVDVFFPDDLRPLITLKSDLDLCRQKDSPLLDMFADVIQELSPSSDFDHLLARTVKSTNRFFGAERGGIFWFRRHGTPKGPSLRGPCNLSPADVGDEEFKQSLALVFKAFRENSPQVVRREDFNLNPSRVKAMLCVPFEVEGHVRGILYHDNSYVRDCFDSFSTVQLSQMARWLTSYIGHIFQFSRRLEKNAADRIGQMEPSDPSEIITKSPVMKTMLGQVRRIADSDSTVLILGETGVGKELLARQIHQMSRRNSNPMVIIDPTVIPESLVESELFGHEKGAFTGADRQKKGRLELAHNGTLFIDEVGEIPPSIQVKLLRAIQEKTMLRIGGSKSIYSDFRLVAATNRDLAEEVAAGRFREDLYYRLNVIPITLPPLRKRAEDILLLAGHFLNRFAVKYNREPLDLSPEDQNLLASYPWPGNIRELQNVMERAVLLASDGRLHLDLPAGQSASPRSYFTDLPTLDDLQRQYIQYVLEKTGGKMSGADSAAQILGMKRTSLYNRMKKLGMR